MTTEHAEDLVRDWLANNPERLSCLQDDTQAERQWLAYASKAVCGAAGAGAIEAAARAAEAGDWQKEVYFNNLPTAARRGRPPGQTKATGANVSPGRPALRSATYAPRLAHWRTWFASQQQVSAFALAARMDQTARTVQRYAKLGEAGREPTEAALMNLESLSAAYGFEPLTIDHQLL